tara:strand:- start:284 stop:1111 length:828 start_codon:yes stop_codon:yes gene_type:complete
MLVYVLLCIVIIGSFLYYNKNKDIIVPDIVGGIGNQMFIVASAYAYGRRNNKELVLDGRNNIHSYGGYRHNNNNTIFYHITKNNNLPRLTNLSEDNYYKKVDGNIYLTDGYYQDYQYFNEYKPDIIELFTPSDGILHNIDNLRDKYNMNNNYNICIHIRLEDRFTPRNHEGLYTDEEINMIKHKLSNLDGNKLVFSNDIQRCKNIFINHKDISYINEKDYLELYLMSYCDYYIASPSTFNWWGIYLNKGKYDVFLPWKTETNYRKDFYNKYNILI